MAQKNSTGKKKLIFCALAALIILSLACNLPQQTVAVSTAGIHTSVALTMAAQVTQPVVIALPASHTVEVPLVSTATFTLHPPTPTLTLTPPPTLTETPSQPSISASVNTNCREGPAPEYRILGSLVVGERSEVHGRNSSNTWWYIRNPQKPAEFCWVWAQTTQVSGDTSRLAVITPPPPPASPTPGRVAFSFSLSSLHECGNNSSATFKVTNTGEAVIESLEAYARKKSTLVVTNTFSDAPFHDSRHACPSSGSSSLAPGESAFLALNLGSWPPDADYDVTITLCSANGRSGRCATQTYLLPSP